MSLDGEHQGLLLHGKDDDIGLHPKLWGALGFVYVLLGILQVILASLWGFWLGALFGLSLAKLGTTLVGIGATGGRLTPLPQGASIGMRLKHIGGKIVLWGSRQFQRLFYLFRLPVIAYGLFVTLLLAIRFYSSPDPAINSFPSSCGTISLGCSRVAEQQPHSARGLEPLLLAASLNETQAAVETWISSQASSRVIFANPGFVHARVLTPVFGFADDFMVNLRCTDGNKVLVEAQGQLRIGKSDLGVNARRNQRFFKWLSEIDLPEGKCE